jgi:hypothetical protein
MMSNTSGAAGTERMQISTHARCATAIAALAMFAGTAAAQSIHFFTQGYYASDLSADGRVVVGNLIGPFETFRWTADTGEVLLGEATVPVLGTGAGSPDISYDGTRISATILTDDATLATQGIWTEGSGWTRAFPPLPPGAAPIDQSIASAWGLSGDGSTVTGFYWGANSTGPFGGAQPNAWSATAGVTVLDRIEGRNARVNDANFDATVFCGWEENDFGQWQPTVWRDGVKMRLSENDAFVGAEKLTGDGDVIVGNSLNVLTLNREPTIWTWNGASYDEQRLGVLPGTPAINGWGVALGVTDDASMVVGANYYTFSPGGTADGFIWTEQTGLVKADDFVAGLGIDIFDVFRIRSVDAISADGSTILVGGQSPVTFDVFSAIIRIVPNCNAADLVAPFEVLDLGDVDAFIAAFLIGGDDADIAAPFGIVDLADIDTFIAAFLAGCPFPS